MDPGDAEEGYAGNGTPALARDPDEVASTAVPFGCRVPEELPRPSHALEVDYRFGGRPVVAVRSTFASESEARAYFRHRSAAVQGCSGVEVDKATGPLVSDVRRVDRRTLLNIRTPESQPWFEIAVRSGRDVVLVAIQGPDPTDRMDAARTARHFS